MKTKYKIIIIIAVVLGLCVWDIFIDPPAWWRFERQQDKNAILNYVESHYPDTIKRKGSKFPIQLPAGPHEYSEMYFELDGIRFCVEAMYGDVVYDGYSRARAAAQFDEIIQNGFLKSRGLSAQTDYSFVGFYSDEIPYPFTGDLSVKIKVFDQGSTPEGVGWLYDFYEYWKSEGAFLEDYGVLIQIIENGESKRYIRYNKDSEFSGESIFYATFKYGYP